MIIRDQEYYSLYDIHISSSASIKYWNLTLNSVHEQVSPYIGQTLNEEIDGML